MRPSLIFRCRTQALLAALILGLAANAQAAEPKKGPSPNPFQGFSADNGKPVDITSEALEVHQEEQLAIFTGSVVAKQGDSTLCAPKLIVYYDNATPADKDKDKAQGGDKDKTPAAAAATPAPAAATATPAAAPAPAAAGVAGPGDASAIKKLEASGGVVVTAKDQIATGQSGVFDMAANIATLYDNVVLTQGNSVIKGKKLVVDMKTGVARVEGSGGGVSSIFQKTPQATAPTSLSCNSVSKGSTP